MKKIDYVLLDPTGNKTLLVTTPVDRSLQPMIASKLMEIEPQAEQAGYFTRQGKEIGLRMAGGEFCGNATMCAAALAAIEDKISQGTMKIHASGTSKPVPVAIQALPDGSLQGKLAMPRPIAITETKFGGKTYPLVCFDGIAHVIVEADMDRKTAEQLAPLWCESLEADALGLMLLDQENMTMQPLVYVPTASTLCWENSCASGTTAVGVYLFSIRGPLSLSLKQPGGTLHIDADQNGDLFLSGKVRLLHRQSAIIE